MTLNELNTEYQTLHGRWKAAAPGSMEERAIRAEMITLMHQYQATRSESMTPDEAALAYAQSNPDSFEQSALNRRARR